MFMKKKRSRKIASASHEFRNFQGLIPPTANKSESVQKKSKLIGIVNIFKLTNQNERNGLKKTPLKCK